MAVTKKKKKCPWWTYERKQGGGKEQTGSEIQGCRLE